MRGADTEVAVVGGGVVGCAVAHALARRGVAAVLLEAEPGLALGASGANSGILHTGFDSEPGALETELIVRAGALRAELLDDLRVSVWRCGAMLSPQGADERDAVRALAANARANGVRAALLDDGRLEVPGEAVTDPVSYVHALAAAARAGGAEVRLRARVQALAGAGGGVALELANGTRVRARAAVNCAGLHADELARAAGDDHLAVYPRKGEFLVFAPPAGERLERILLPVPSAAGKGVLVFPALDGHVIAGPTAREREDKRDWSVEADAQELIRTRAERLWPALERSRVVGAYAGLRPAGRGVNYVIERSRALPALIHAAAIRSTGLSASLAIGERVASMLGEAGHVRLGAERRLLAAQRDPEPEGPWWERAARHHGEAAR